VSGILVYKGRYLWCLANGQVYEKSGSGPIRHLPHIQDAAVLAVDWLTDTLYWASSKHNMVGRILCGIIIFEVLCCDVLVFYWLNNVSNKKTEYCFKLLKSSLLLGFMCDHI